MQSIAEISEKWVIILSVTPVQHRLERRHLLCCILAVSFADLSFGPSGVVLRAGCKP